MYHSYTYKNSRFLWFVEEAKHRPLVYRKCTHMLLLCTLRVTQSLLVRHHLEVFAAVFVKWPIRTPFARVITPRINDHQFRSFNCYSIDLISILYVCRNLLTSSMNTMQMFRPPTFFSNFLFSISHFVRSNSIFVCDDLTGKL